MIEEQLHLRLATDQRRQPGRLARLEPALDVAARLALAKQAPVRRIL